MISKEDFKKILATAVNAPSGSNSQPWSFEFKNEELKITALPEKDHPILNFKHRGTWVAHGALLENILISAASLGYKASFDLFPEKSNPNFTVKIRLEKLSQNPDPLYNYIEKRATNRKPYRAAPLSTEQKTELSQEAIKITGAELRLIEDRDAIKSIGEASSVSEIVTLENPILHKLFFKEIVWTEKEEKERGGGLFIKTMEFKPPQKLVLKLILRHWKIMNLLNKLKIARSIAGDNAKIYSSAAAMGAIIVARDNNLDFINAGRQMERIWLTATKLGLSFQLLTGVLFIHQRISSGEFDGLSQDHVDLVKKAYAKIISEFGVASGLPALIFRIGNGENPTATSLKSTPSIVMGS